MKKIDGVINALKDLQHIESTVVDGKGYAVFETSPNTKQLVLWFNEETREIEKVILPSDRVEMKDIAEMSRLLDVLKFC